LPRLAVKNAGPETATGKMGESDKKSVGNTERASDLLEIAAQLAALAEEISGAGGKAPRAGVRVVRDE